MTHALYQWNSPSAIREMVVAKDVKGAKVATLFAAEGADTEKLSLLQDTLLADHGLYSYPKKTETGQHVLVVHDFTNVEQVMSALQIAQVTHGIAGKTLVKDNEDRPISLQERFDHFRRNSALKVSGISGLIGHALMATSGFIERDSDKFRVASIYTVNCLIFAAYGNGDRGLRADPVIAKMRGFLSENGIDLDTMPIEDVVKEYEKNKPLAKKLDAFVAQNSIMLAEGIAVICNLLAIKNGFARGEQGMGMLINGALTLTGSLWAMLVKETPLEQQPAALTENPFGKPLAQAIAHPMTVNALTNWGGLMGLFADPYSRYKLLTDPEVQNKAVEKFTTAKTDLASELEKLEGLTLNKEDTTVPHFEKIAPDGTSTRVHTAETTHNIGVLERDIAGQRKNLDLIEKGNVVWQIQLAMNAFYLVATACNAISSKNAAEDKDPARRYEELFARSAQIALTVAPEDREQVIRLMGSGLAASHPEVNKIQAKDIANHIRQMTQDLEQSPFVPKMEHLRSIDPNKTTGAVPAPSSTTANNIVPIPKEYTATATPASTIDAEGGVDHAVLSHQVAQHSATLH
jgi:hypothetical protein